MKLPMENKTIKNGTGNDIVVNTFQGNDDIRTYTVDEWAAVMERTGQTKEACSLKAAPFGYTQAVIETIKTEAEFKERVAENCMRTSLADHQAMLFGQQWQ